MRLFCRICRGGHRFCLLSPYDNHNQHDNQHVDIDKHVNVNKHIDVNVNFNKHNNKQSRPLMLAPWQACPHQKD